MSRPRPPLESTSGRLTTYRDRKHLKTKAYLDRLRRSCDPTARAWRELLAPRLKTVMQAPQLPAPIAARSVLSTPGETSASERNVASPRAMPI